MMMLDMSRVMFRLCSPAVCETKDVCPPLKDPDSGYVAQSAEACTYDAMLPTGFELDSGKRFSCECRCAQCYFHTLTSRGLANTP